MLAVYMAPTKSLVRERASDWNNKFSELGVKVIELTGDADPNAVLPVATDAHLICTTPEKWEAQWRTGRKQVSSAKNLDRITRIEQHHIHFRRAMAGL